MDVIEPTLRSSLKDLIDPDTFGAVLRSFKQLMRVPIRIFDAEGNLVVESGDTNAACDYLNTFENARARCTVIRSRLRAAPPPADPDRLDKISCFCGLVYAIGSITYQNEAMGKLVIGPFMTPDYDRIPEEVMELDRSIDVAQLSNDLSATRKTPTSSITMLATTVRAVVDAVLLSAHKAQVTNQMHMATVRESYRELSEKNRKLEEMAEERKEFDRHRSNFLAMVSHELRTPLTSIIGYSDMLTEGIAGELADEQKQFVTTIKTKGDELLRLISSILDFTKIDSGRLTLQPVRIQIKDVVENAVRRTMETANRRGIRLSSTVPGGLPETHIDPEKIETAISHLIDNAVKFSSPGGVVKVTAQVVNSTEEDGDEDGVGFVLMSAPDMLEVCVEDFGVGIADQDIPQIFAPFTQLDESSTREHGGAGLGLAIVKHYVEAHGGRVHVRSHEGEGTSFYIRIPLVTDNGLF